MQLTLRVTSVRSQDPKGFGGCIFSAKPIDGRGNVVDANSYYVVRASAAVLSRAIVQRGQWWTIEGRAATLKRDLDGFLISEIQVEATAASMLRPSGEHIVMFLAENPEFERIGEVKARKLWDTFGNDLFKILDEADVRSLSSVLSDEIAATAVAAWSKHGNTQTLQWLQREGFSIELGRKVLRFFGAEAAARIAEDPYRLLSFCAGWRQVDELAQRHFHVSQDDPRRLQGAVEEACSRVFSAGHTTALSSDLMRHLAVLLGSQSRTFPWRELVETALSQGLSNGSFVVGRHGVHPLGALVMESEIAAAVAQRVPAMSRLLRAREDVDSVLTTYEGEEGIRLNAQQRDAVHLAAERQVALITGGAGVGKTTVLKALYRVYDSAACSVTQLALAGRAAKRMQEATGRPASTIANFLRTSSPGMVGSDDAQAFVVDEASMVDVVTMSELVRRLPPSARLVLVGDPAQLMPVGPGLVLHALARVEQVPLAELKVVKRYGGTIAEAAEAIRVGRWPMLPSAETAAIAFIRSSIGSGAESIVDTVLRLYAQDPSNTQVLCARRGGEDGTRNLNLQCQAASTAGAEPVLVWSPQHGELVLTGFRLGDPILCTRNMWDRGLQNGSLGVVSEVVKQSNGSLDDEGQEQVLAWVDWDDGIRRPIAGSMLDDLDLGYAITIHKAQGSQWPRIIVPLTANRLLDRTLIYTAVTRAQRQVLLVGDELAAKAAVESDPRASTRSVGLDLLLREQLQATSQRVESIPR